MMFTDKKTGLSIYKNVILFLIICVMFTIFNIKDIKAIELFMQIMVFIVVFFAVKDNDYSIDKLITVVIILGLIMRIGYMLYTPINLRSHDLGSPDQGSSLHLGYIYRLYNGHLPESNNSQFYHPPLFHFLAAMMTKILGSRVYRTDFNSMFEASKVISCYASCASIFIVKRLCEELKLKQRGTFVALVIVAFHPTFYLMAGRVNNDSLSVFFILLSILYTAIWFNKPKYKNVIILAFAIGLGMMTKISAGAMALFTGPLMLYVLYKNFKISKKDGINIFLQLITFGVICFPLALWYPIRNMILFNQPLNYVLPAADVLYCGDYSFAERFLSLPLSDMFTNLYNRPYDDYNVPMYIIKCSIFGEFGYNVSELIAKLFIVVNMLMIAISLAATIYTALSKKVEKFVKTILIAVWAIFFLSYININITLPYGCTMDFRYIVPTAVLGAIMIGITAENTKNIAIRKTMYYIIFLFTVCSFLMYTTIN